MSQYRKEGQIAIDGKSIKSTVRASQEPEPNFVSLVTFFHQQSHLIVTVGKLENQTGSEINQVRELLEKLKISKAVFTLDALDGQKKTVEMIVQGGNSYVIAVKKNQLKLYSAIEKQTQTTSSNKSLSL